MVSKTAEYALRACLWLAEHPESAWTVRRIATAIDVPARYLAKVMAQLRRGDLVRAQPGPGGGFALSRAASQLSVLDVVEAVAASPRPRDIPAGAAGNGKKFSTLQARLDQALASMEKSFQRCTLAELLQGTHQPESHERNGP